MALNYKITTFDAEVDTSNNPTGKKNVGFEVTDDSNKGVYFINKSIEIGSKTDDEITDEAYIASKDQVDAWVASRANLGKTFDPISKKVT